jgi:hypothetical protein
VYYVLKVDKGSFQESTASVYYVLKVDKEVDYLFRPCLKLLKRREECDTYLTHVTGAERT